MGKEVRLLLSSAGRRVALMDCFRRDAEALGLSLTVIAVDIEPALSAACNLADAAFPVPRCTDPGFIPSIMEIASREGVQLIVPTIDPELIPYAQASSDFARIGAAVSVPGRKVVEIARDKHLTAEVLRSVGVGVPRTMRLSDYLALGASWSEPLILKPLQGSASVGIRRAYSRADVESLSDVADGYIVQELWEGPEYTVNMFFDSHGTLRCVVPHRRIEVRAGEVSKGRTERISGLRRAAEAMSRAFPAARGALCFQAIRTDGGDVGVFEINARFGGGYPLAHAAGAAFTRWLLEEAAGLQSSVTDNWRAGVTMLRYDAAVFRDDHVE